MMILCSKAISQGKPPYGAGKESQRIGNKYLKLSEFFES
jgi:hypothetical protein